jgi:hypothetical protein
MAPMEMVEQVDKMTDDQLERHALTILQHELGVYGLARFLRVYRAGTGDYTQDRPRWLDGLSVEDALRDASV